MRNPVIDKHGNRCWYNREGRLHRTNGPALIKPDGSRYWYCDGEIHRVGGPAVILAGESLAKSWCSESWFIRGNRHRSDGPAAILTNGGKAWFLHDDVVQKEDFKSFEMVERMQALELFDPFELAALIDADLR